VRHEDKLGKLAMRIIGITIVVMLVAVVAIAGVHAFPFAWWGFAGAVVLAVISFAVAQVE
jgi:hypothetical protein